MFRSGVFSRRAARPHHLIDLASCAIRVVLLDIEGTTTPIAFVHETLFPYARIRLRTFLRAHEDSPDVRHAGQLLLAEHAADLARHEPAPAVAPGSLEALTAYIEWLMDRDRKSPGLKLLQGLIWEDGYRSGELGGQVFPDVAPAVRRWRTAGVRVAIYSSGSELAQRRLFESTPDGDLTPLLSALFDTRVGAKIDAASYVRIAKELDVPAAAVLFVSDLVRELSAAREAGMHPVLSVRPGNSPQGDDTFEHVTTFDEIASAAGS